MTFIAAEEMTQFAPSVWTADPPNRPDFLAGAVLSSLSRPLIGNRRKPWGLIKSAVLGGLSFGLLPLLVWPRRFRDFVTVEQQQLWHLAEWLRVRTGRPEAVELRDVWAPRLLPKPAAWALPTLLAVVVVFIFFNLAMGSRFSWDDLLAMTYSFQTPAAHVVRSEHARFFWRAWTLCLSAGYFLHWVQVCKHAGAIADYARKFNALTAREGVPPVGVRGVGVGFHPLWLLAALFAAGHGAVWAAPMAVAGVVHSRYVWVTSRRVRSDFAQRVRSMLQSQRPALDVPLPAKLLAPETLRLACVNDKCRAAVPPGAAFCPRCGARASGVD